MISINTDLSYDDNSTIAGWFYRYCILWGVFSSVAIFVLIYAGIRTNSIFALKDLVIYMLALAVFPKIFNHRKSIFMVFFLLVFLWYMYINYLVLNPTYDAAVNNIRQILSPLLILFIYCQLQLNRSSAEHVLNFLCRIIILVFLLGIAEQVFEIWPKLDLSVFFSLKGIPTDEKGLAYMFYEPLFGGRERMTSTFIDPISLGHFFSSAGILLFYIKNKTRLLRITYYFCLAGMFFALSKGAIFQFFIAVILLNSRINLMIRLALCAGPFILVSVIDSAGIAIHVQSFINAINTISFFGYGIGNAGNYAYMFGSLSGIAQKLQIGDTYIGSLIGQIGFFGTVLWTALGIGIIYQAVEIKKHASIGLIIFISIFAVSILSENTMNITSFILPAILIGLSLNIERIIDEN